MKMSFVNYVSDNDLISDYTKSFKIKKLKNLIV